MHALAVFDIRQHQVVFCFADHKLRLRVPQNNIIWPLFFDYFVFNKFVQFFVLLTRLVYHHTGFCAPLPHHLKKTRGSYILFDYGFLRVIRVDLNLIKCYENTKNCSALHSSLDTAVCRSYSFSSESAGARWISARASSNKVSLWRAFLMRASA